MNSNYNSPNSISDDQPGQGTSPDPHQFDIALQGENLAKHIDEDKLRKIADECYRGYEDDEASRKTWMDQTKEWLKLAGQVKEAKTYPWPGAANLKYPLISTAAMQFSARAYPSLIPSDGNIVQAKVYGNDPTGLKTEVGNRISKYMSWQLMEDLDYWEEDMDKLLMQVSIIGIMHKKTYYCKATDKMESILVYPENFVVDYWTRNLEDCPRISEILELNKNDIETKKLSEEYLDVDLGSAPTPTMPLSVPVGTVKKSDDWTAVYKIIEQHTWLDLDDDGLREPYIVTFDHGSKKILRISARYTKKGVKLNEKNKPICYEAVQYYTKFGFIPNPDGSYYDLGFGHLLGPINDGINTILNQMIDSGTLANMQVGFIGKGLRMKMGTNAFQPGEWKAVNATGDDLRKQIVPLPAKEPSNVLFELLQMLITSGKELASVAEIFTGKMPGQNTPATTTMATIEQGMKVFTAIYKRIYRSLSKEFKKLFDLNGYYLDKDTYAAILGGESVGPEDFDPEVFDICPTADPTATTQTEKLMKAQGLMELLQSFGPTAMPMEVVLKRVLEAQEQPNIAELIPGMQQTGKPTPMQPPPDPKIMAIQEKSKAEQAKLQMEGQARQQELQQDAQSHQQDMQFQAAKHQMDLQQQSQQLQADAVENHARMNMEMQKAQMQQHIGNMQTQTGMNQQEATHDQTMRHTEESHGQKIKQGEEAHKSKLKLQEQSSRSGKRTKSQT